MSGILAGKQILVTGVITERSIAYAVARRAQLEGATVVLTGVGRLSLVERVARRLPQPAPVVELDVTDTPQLASLAARLDPHVDGLDGILHSIAFAPQTCLGGGFPTAPWADVSTAMEVSAYSLAALAAACRPLLRAHASIVGLDFDATKAWPDYDWMGVAKSALESTCRYLARYLGPEGIRVNLVAAGPLRTVAALSVPDGTGIESDWAIRAPLGWDPQDREPVARACTALLSDWFSATTGEILHVDGGRHAVGA